MRALTEERGTSRPPTHVAVIMDGNRRWARARGLPAVAGHKRGADAVRRTVEGCGDLGIGYLTLYAFSSENWRRPEAEVSELMNLLRIYLKNELRALCDNNVRVRFLGERSGLAADILEMMAEADAVTAANDALTLTVALNYGSRRAIALAARNLAQAAAEGRLDPKTIDEARFEEALDSHDLPPPDLLIRTSGEQRLSNFLLWEMAYTEFVFLPVAWPDFNREHLESAVSEYARRERRYGASVG